MFRKNFSILSFLLLTCVTISIFAMDTSTPQVKEEVINFFLDKYLKKFDEADLNKDVERNEVMLECAVFECITAGVGFIKKSNTFRDNINTIIGNSSTKVGLYIECYSTISIEVFSKKRTSECKTMKKEMDDKAREMK